MQNSKLPRLIATLVMLNPTRYGQCIRCYATRTPRFMTTLKEASKPPLTAPVAVTAPVGYASRPVLSSPHTTTTLFLRNPFSLELREARQVKLDHDLKHSPFYESRSFLNTKGKIFNSPQLLFKSSRALYFPDFFESTLTGNKRLLSDVTSQSAVTVVRVFSAVLGQKSCDTWTTTDYPDTTVVDINVPQTWFKLCLVRLSRSLLKRAVPAPRHPTYFIVPESVFDFRVRQKLLCDNMCLGYIYVLDRESRIRWLASGDAGDTGVNTLHTIVNALRQERD